MKNCTNEREKNITYEIKNAINNIIENKTEDINYRSLVESNAVLKKYFNTAQLTQIIYGLGAELDVFQYAKPELTAEDMYPIRHNLQVEEFKKEAEKYYEIDEEYEIE
ncbi:hypothetical protein [Anaerofustis butyriciformans]|uniref:hypothetical protein n=1 Tax=Anaerofustis butyriciformans TaxID=3108533 RepID=UPI002E361236|nr:hypothetical protein [Anaerofustis sp. HA2171]